MCPSNDGRFSCHARHHSTGAKWIRQHNRLHMKSRSREILQELWSPGARTSLQASLHQR
ncbi:hypothetical protein BJY01DRAFT_211171 [Aspergillus pseudoustus]|uniref:Ig-like domain-containing protein n=1 Tax=Aspergillus pseudoustus TaxID=1810923 RepID=A0ABR4KA63_9EURO